MEEFGRPGASMTRTAIATLFDKWFDAWQRLDPAAVAELYAPDAVLKGPIAGLRVGRASIESFCASMIEALPDLACSNEQIVIEENRAALFWRVSGTHRGQLFGYPGSGQRVVIDCAGLFVVSEAGIEHEERRFDFTGFLLQASILTAKPV